MQAQMSPDFIIFGWHDKEHNKYCVAASSELEQAKVEAIYKDPEPYIAGPFKQYDMSTCHYVITAKSKESGQGKDILVIVWGDTYEEAFKRLMEFWTPNIQDPELPSQKALGT